MKLDLERTARGKSSLAIEGRLSIDFGAGGPAGVAISGDLTVTNLESRFLLNGTLQASGEAECGRCLGSYALSYEVPVEIVVLRDLETDEGEGDTLTIRQRTGEVELGPALRESAILAVPQSRVCRAECRGYCPRCGADLNRQNCTCAEDETDPRWAGLPD